VAFFKKLKQFRSAYEVFSSDAYKETMSSLERVAGSTHRLLAAKPREQQIEISARVRQLTDKITDLISDEIPLVAGLSLTTAIRVLDETLQQESSRQGSASES